MESQTITRKKKTTKLYTLTINRNNITGEYYWEGDSHPGKHQLTRRQVMDVLLDARTVMATWAEAESILEGES